VFEVVTVALGLLVLLVLIVLWLCVYSYLERREMERTREEMRKYFNRL